MRATNQLPHVGAQDAVQAAYIAISALQGLQPGTQVAGTALLLHVMVQQLGIDLSSLMDQCRRRFDNGNTTFQREAQALSDYVNGELR
jgi:hypothetical protein